MGNSAGKGVFSIIFTSMIVVSMVYVILHHASGFKTVSTGFGKSYAGVTKTFEGG